MTAVMAVRSGGVKIIFLINRQDAKSAKGRKERGFEKHL
jgi:hypothetical protein